MNTLTNKVKDFIVTHRLLKKGDKILVGVSGGPDSLSLLHFLTNLREDWNLDLTAAHVDHMFRGEQSYNEMKYVKKICKEWNVKFEGKRIDVPKAIEETSGNPQTISRNLRYQFYKEVMKKHHISLLALGHHGDDQMETILMRLTRGASIQSAGGIRVKRPFADGFIIRPFLCLCRSEIEQYIKYHHLKPAYDPSNEKDIYTRNRYRKYVLPFLKQENQNAHIHFQQFSEDLLADHDYLMKLAEEELDTIVQEKSEQKVAFSISKFLQLSLPLQRRCIHLILNYLNESQPIPELSINHIHSAIELIRKSGPSRKLDFPRNIQVICSYDTCLIGIVEKKKPFHYTWHMGETITLPDGNQLGMIKGGKQEGDLFFRLSTKTKFPLSVRTRKDGDRIRLKGKAGTKKVKSLFIEAKIPVFERDLWPIVTDAAGKILWIPGIKNSGYEAMKDEDAIILYYKLGTSGRN